MDHSSPSPNSGTEISLTDGLEFCASAHAAPSAPGAYLLQIDLSEPIFVRIARKSCTELSAGRYFYCGSANGPGGLRSRLARHMRHGKTLHWHIDQLTVRGTVTGAWIVRNGRECDLVAILARCRCQFQGLPAIVCAAGATCCTGRSEYQPASSDSKILPEFV